ncbi:MAG: trypsin-like peptidase domain-containing protein [Hyphomicrobiaceae bacterium]
MKISIAKSAVGVWARASLVAAVVSAVCAGAAAQDVPQLPDLVDQVSPGVVSVAATVPAAAPQKAAPGKKAAPATATQLGAGMVISPEGHVVTSAHIVKGASQINVRLNEGPPLSATVVGIDEPSGIALLKVAAGAPLAPVAFTDSSQLRRGQPVFAIGNPFGLAGSVSTGIVAGLDRVVGNGPLGFLQTDAAISKGNAGGPLFDYNGSVVGMVASVLSGAGAGAPGIAFAVPANEVSRVSQSLRLTGTVARGWLGVRIRTVDATIGQSIGLGAAGGALVEDVIAGGPGIAAGLRKGDAVLAVDDVNIDTMRDLARRMAERAPGSVVKLSVWRGGQLLELSLRLGTFPKSLPK